MIASQVILNKDCFIKVPASQSVPTGPHHSQFFAAVYLGVVYKVLVKE